MPTPTQLALVTHLTFNSQNNYEETPIVNNDNVGGTPFDRTTDNG